MDTFPTNVGTLLPRLKYFNVFKNAFTVSIPSSLGDLNSLQVLNLFDNQFSCKIPEHLAMVADLCGLKAYKK